RLIGAATTPPLPRRTSRGSRATAPEALTVRRDAGVHSGREIARRLRRNLAFRYLAGDGPVPDFRTVNRFRLRHREDVAWVLRETGRLAWAAGPGAAGTGGDRGQPRSGPKRRDTNSAAGRRGRRRRAYEAPRAAADGGTWLGGAESKRRRRPRLPAPPSRVTLPV